MCACEREEGRAGGREEEEEGVVGERWKLIGKGEIERKWSREKAGKKLV